MRGHVKGDETKKQSRKGDEEEDGTAENIMLEACELIRERLVRRIVAAAAAAAAGRTLGRAGVCGDRGSVQPPVRMGAQVGEAVGRGRVLGEGRVLTSAYNIEKRKTHT